jgi:hypothetical protein
MSQYTTYDLQATLDITSIEKEKIEKVIAAWGQDGDYGEWMGGFLLAMKSGNFIYIDGWCDTTGWGCQDGADASEYLTQPKLADLPTSGYTRDPVEWDFDPIDLNRYIAGKNKGMDDL